MEPNNLNEWWGGQPDGLKQAFSLFPDGRWKEADLYLRINIRNYCLLKKGGLLPEDKDRSMLSEIVCELADTELCRANGKDTRRHVRYGRGFSGRVPGTVQPDIR